MTIRIRETILSGLAEGQATLPKLLPDANPCSRYVAATRLEKSGLIARVGTTRPKNAHGGRRRIVWKLAGALVLFAADVQAEPLAYVQNQAGGRVVITDDESKLCPERTKLAYTTGNGLIFLGCWKYDKLTVTIWWFDKGGAMSYPIESFVAAREKGA